MDPLQFADETSASQDCVGACRRCNGLRQCLLKGCEKWFQCTSPQARYCSAECREEACRWRRWRASRRYRTTPQGKVRRQAQSCRYRERKRECRRSAKIAAEAAEVPPEVPPEAPPEAPCEVPPETPCEGPPETPCEGQRAAENPEDFGNCACDRPGCYDLFKPQPRSPQQHFCSAACRQALRRVLDRERRLRSRRRRGIPSRRRYSHGPP